MKVTPSIKKRSPGCKIVTRRNRKGKKIVYVIAKTKNDPAWSPRFKQRQG